MTSDDTAPLQPVMNGGGVCSEDSECGRANGQCIHKKCKCDESVATGPHCLAPRGFDDIVWDVDPPIPVYHMYLPSSLVLLVAWLSVLFVGIVFFKYQQQRRSKGRSPLPCFEGGGGGGGASSCGRYVALNDSQSVVDV
eukprot:gene14508-18525_t